MADIGMYIAETDVAIDPTNALGFFGSDGFGDPLSLNEYNGRTFATTTSGSVGYEECDNCRRISSTGVIVGQTGTGINIRNLPNYLATVNFRFTHPQSVLVQNAQLTAIDSNGNTPTGLAIYGAEIIHTSRLQSVSGTGDTTWLSMGGAAQQIDLVNSPGTYGLSPFGPATISTRHDWYVALSVAPTIPGDKQFFFKLSVEFV